MNLYNDRIQILFHCKLHFLQKAFEEICEQIPILRLVIGKSTWTMLSSVWSRGFPWGFSSSPLLKTNGNFSLKETSLLCPLSSASFYPWGSLLHFDHLGKYPGRIKAVYRKCEFIITKTMLYSVFLIDRNWCKCCCDLGKSHSAKLGTEFSPHIDDKCHHDREWFLLPEIINKIFSEVTHSLI